MNKHQQILERFCGTDKLRAWMMTPNRVGDTVFATDANAMVMVPSKYDPDRLETDEKTAKLLLSVSDYQKTSEHVITLESITAALARIPQKKVPATKKCKCCDGEGFVEYDYEYENIIYSKELDCPICEGDGEVNDPTKPDTLEYEDGKVINILESYFRPQILEMLGYAIATAEATECTLVCQKGKEKASFFAIGDIIVLLMPCISQTKNAIVLL